MQLSNLQSALSPDVAGTFFVKEIEFMTDKSSAVALRKEKKKKKLSQFLLWCLCISEENFMKPNLNK